MGCGARRGILGCACCGAWRSVMDWGAVGCRAQKGFLGCVARRGVVGYTGCGVWRSVVHMDALKGVLACGAWRSVVG